tara:strand:- start:2324 stop:2791 length:468 start_codon:yes stop_codon:yes gene_type:complete
MNCEIVVYGSEDRQGRALLVVSALHHCGRWLAEKGVCVRFVAASRCVRVAAEILRFQTGLKVRADEVRPDEAPDDVFGSAGLYVAVMFSRLGALALREARARNVPSLVAVQFPDAKQLNVSVLENLRAAFDPVDLSNRLCEEVLRIEARRDKGRA